MCDFNLFPTVSHPIPEFFLAQKSLLFLLSLPVILLEPGIISARWLVLLVLSKEFSCPSLAELCVGEHHLCDSPPGVASFPFPWAVKWVAFIKSWASTACSVMTENAASNPPCVTETVAGHLIPLCHPSRLCPWLSVALAAVTAAQNIP